MNKFIFIFFLLTNAVTFAEDTNPAPKAGKLATEDDAQRIQNSISEIFRLYESGSLAMFQKKFDPSVVGLQKLVDAIAIESAQCKQIRVNLLNTKVTVGTDVAVLQTAWEKRCLQMPNLTPQMQTGEGSFMLHKSAFGWQIAGLTGTMPFSTINVPATLTASTTTTCTTIKSTSTVAISVPFTIVVFDPTRANQASVQVQLASGIDNETWTLNADRSAPGTFSVTTILANQGPATSNSGSLQVLVTGGACSNVRINYNSSSVMNGIRTLTKTVNWL
ncbi:MAG: hypothetical protein K0R29_2483 [Pseudobdellovibrio sp.]|jgi:hypothetical protein|nr:hypothetical protein [Pseudobdellovibrio sp.]